MSVKGRASWCELVVGKKGVWKRLFRDGSEGQTPADADLQQVFLFAKRRNISKKK